MVSKFLIPALLSGSLCMACSMHPEDSQKEVAPSIPRYENNVFIEADFIYWVAKQEGNNYATTGSAITVPGTTDPNTGFIAGAVDGAGQVYAPNTKIKPGVKVGLGINLEHSQWDLSAEYTYLYSNANGSISSNNLNSGILPLFAYTPYNSILGSTSFAAASGATGFVSKASSSWSLHFNNMNLELGKYMKLTSFVEVHPHFGLQASWQQQHFDNTYSVASLTSASENLGNNKVNFKQNFWGVGIRMGLDSTWKFLDHFGLFLNSAVSALWGQFKCHAHSYDSNNLEGYSSVLIADQINSLHTISPVLELSTGLQYDWFLYDEYRLLIQAGWEEQIWFLQNQHSSSIADTSLILQGLTIKFRFDF